MRLDAPRFRTALVESLSAAQRSGEPLCVWWLDVDDCSALNDRFGEAAVDEAFGRLERELEALGAVFARMEGAAAWAVALLGLSGREGEARAEALRQRQGEAAGEPRLSLSVGVAVKRKGEPALNLLEAAELACTRAKQGGRGCVVAR